MKCLRAVAVGDNVVGRGVMTVDAIHVSSRKKVDIINPIDSIVFLTRIQTRILAWHAFVALKVRTLAQRFAAAVMKINRVTKKTNQVTLQNLAWLERTAGIAQSLQNQVAQLFQVINIFKLGSRDRQAFIGLILNNPAHATLQGRRHVWRAKMAGRCRRQTACGLWEKTGGLHG